MKALRKLLLVMAVSLMACIAWGEPINYVNTELPGIHQAQNPNTGEMCWYDDMGNNLCTVENSLPMVEMDKFFFFMGDKNNSWVKKEWDKKRDCYVWKSIDGDFLGTDPESLSQKDLDWLANVDPSWFDENGLPGEINNQLWKMKYEQIAKHAEKEMEEYKKEQASQLAKDSNGDADNIAKQDEVKNTADKAKANEKLKEVDQYMNMTDEQIRQAEAEIAKARAQLKATGMTEYMGYLDQAQEAINQAKAARAKYKQQRGGQ